MDYYDFFKLCKIDVSEDDVSSLEKDGFDMETIFFTVQNGTEENINSIMTSLKTKISKALSIRFSTMCLIIREYMNHFTSNGMIAKSTTMVDIMEWNNMERNLDSSSSLITKPKINDSIPMENTHS